MQLILRKIMLKVFNININYKKFKLNFENNLVRLDKVKIVMELKYI